MLREEFSAVIAAKDKASFKMALVDFANQMEFSIVTAATVIDRGTEPAKIFSISNAPSTYAEIEKDVARSQIDPVLQYLKRNCAPLVWTRQTYIECGQSELWDQQAPFGYHTGVAMAMHLPGGQHFLFGVDREQALPSDPKQILRIVADLQLFAVHAQETALRLLLPENAENGKPSLTPRELEVLRWTMDGKTAWEVGTILGISERTAVRHRNNAIGKLNCVNKVQAVIRALRLGLIQ